jgi:Ca2+-binding EF-hand superfamily protein
MKRRASTKGITKSRNDLVGVSLADADSRTRFNALKQNLEVIIDRCVEQIWNVYDDDKNGYIDKKEFEALIQDSLGIEKWGWEYSETAFNTLFATLDKDGNQTISPDEMKRFITSVITIDL